MDELRREDFTRVNVVGVSGSGKSTFSTKLAEALNSPYIQMDQLYHGPNWTEAEVPVFRDRIAAAIAAEHWVLDGNYHSKTYDLKWQRATAIIWIDTSWIRTVWQAITRAINRAWTQKELWPGTGNRESFRKLLFSRHSVVLWTLTSFGRIRQRYEAVQNDPQWSHLTFIRLRTRKEAGLLLKSLAETDAS